MLDACPLPSDDDVAGSIVGQNVEAFTRLICEASRALSARRFQQTLEELSRRRGVRAVFHKHEQEGATPSAGIMDREPGQVSGAASKADGAREGLRCESVAIRQQNAPRRAS